MLSTVLVYTNSKNRIETELSSVYHIELCIAFNYLEMDDKSVYIKFTEA